MTAAIAIATGLGVALDPRRRNRPRHHRKSSAGSGGAGIQPATPACGRFSSRRLRIAAGLGVAAVVEDLRRRRVPDWLTAAGAAGTLLSYPRTAAIPYAPAIVFGAWVSLLVGGS